MSNANDPIEPPSRRKKIIKGILEWGTSALVIVVGLGLGVGIIFWVGNMREHAAEARLEQLSSLQERTLKANGSYTDNLSSVSSILQSANHRDSAYSLIHMEATESNWCAVSTYDARIDPRIFVLYNDGYKIMAPNPSKAIDECASIIETIRD